MAEPLLAIRGLRKRFGGLLATDQVDLDVVEGETYAIIGPNGAGKTTLIGQLAGDLRPDDGAIQFAGRDVTRLDAPLRSRLGLARSFQITSIFREFSALDNVALAIQAHAGHSFRFWKPARGDTRLIDPARRVLEEVGLQNRTNVLAANLSHGEQRQLEIALALAGAPKLLLLDEPTAGLSPAESQMMTALLKRLDPAITLLVIEHDMDVAFALADRITVLHYGRVVADGRADEVRASPLVQEIYLGTLGSA